MRIFATLAAFVFFGSCTLCQAQTSAPAGKTLYHVVSFKYKETAKPEQIKEVDAAFAALKTKVPGSTLR